MELNTYWVVVRNNHFAVNKDFSHVSHQNIQQNQQIEAFQSDKKYPYCFSFSTPLIQRWTFLSFCDSHSIFDTFDTDASI